MLLVGTDVWGPVLSVSVVRSGTARRARDFARTAVVALALGVLFLMCVTSFAVVAYFRARPDTGAGPWRTLIAPLISGVLMLVVVILGVANFNVLITSTTDAPTDTTSCRWPISTARSLARSSPSATREEITKRAVRGAWPGPTADGSGPQRSS